MTTKTIQKISLITGLTLLAVIWRLINHQYQIAPNLELVTVLAVVAAVTLGWRAAIVAPLAALAMSDALIGNSSIMAFTWGSFALIGFGAVLLRHLNERPQIQILGSIGFAATSSSLFFIVTNFGVWLQGWYPPTLAGLGACYAMALPFYRTMFIGNLILVPATIGVWQLIRVHQAAKASVVDTLISDELIVKVML